MTMKKWLDDVGGLWKSHVAECSFVIKGLIVFLKKLS